jgi:hypothetical protein
MKILIVGDSFAADWSVKYNQYLGWPELLSHDYDVTNLAQAGVSEYKILLQIESVADIKDYDIVIVSHTNIYRIHTRKHPIHRSDILHNNADIMLNDCTYHAKRPWNWFNRSLLSAIGFIKYHFDEEYYKKIYTFFRDSINQKLSDVGSVITIDNFDHETTFVEEKNVLNFSSVWREYPGLINHCSPEGNELIYTQLKQKIEQLRK